MGFFKNKSSKLHPANQAAMAVSGSYKDNSGTLRIASEADSPIDNMPFAPNSSPIRAHTVQYDWRETGEPDWDDYVKGNPAYSISYGTDYIRSLTGVKENYLELGVEYYEQLGNGGSYHAFDPLGLGYFDKDKDFWITSEIGIRTTAWGGPADGVMGEDSDVAWPFPSEIDQKVYFSIWTDVDVSNATEMIENIEGDGAHTEGGMGITLEFEVGNGRVYPSAFRVVGEGRSETHHLCQTRAYTYWIPCREEYASVYEVDNSNILNPGESTRGLDDSTELNRGGDGSYYTYYTDPMWITLRYKADEGRLYLYVKHPQNTEEKMISALDVTVEKDHLDGSALFLGGGAKIGVESLTDDGDQLQLQIGKTVFIKDK